MAELNKKSEVSVLLESLKAEKQTLQELTTPLRDERDRLLASIEPTLKKIRELEKQYRELEQPRLAELDDQISGLSRVLGGKRMSDSSVSTMGG